ncbi:hypothetical protein SAMN05444354_12541 [Stigmatella aurantiaca]|uniref:Lipoprotein n=1 Tax=Stigmatella aurantiaca TaxID=41 RepID=A0A1H8C3H1_STIAU|nr:hypothetical protein [Stigmatella aurantiaca]SEM88994.1 hypothetical protein SAMN05444354_12541 [Stigmatella aurantiaca]
MKTASPWVVVSLLSLSLAACGGAGEGEESIPEVEAGSQTSAAAAGCSITCDDGRTGYYANASTPNRCLSYAYNFCAPVGGTVLVPGYPGVSW